MLKLAWKKCWEDAYKETKAASLWSSVRALKLLCSFYDVFWPTVKSRVLQVLVAMPVCLSMCRTYLHSSRKSCAHLKTAVSGRVPSMCRTYLHSSRKCCAHLKTTVSERIPSMCRMYLHSSRKCCAHLKTSVSGRVIPAWRKHKIKDVSYFFFF